MGGGRWLTNLTIDRRLPTADRLNIDIHPPFC